LTRTVSNSCRRRERLRWAAQVVGLALLVNGCRPHEPPAYQDQQGFRLTPPPGWVERARDGALPSEAGHRQPDLPFPKLGAPRSSVRERLAVRYDRLTAGHLAWLRITVAELPPSTPLEAFVASRSPGSHWKRASDVESLEVSGLPAARIAFRGRWSDQEYLSETVTVRQGRSIYVITASFPAADNTAREQVRQAIARAAWQ
jgi:hypothetical protein